MRVAHVITRMIIGGAQENTLLCCQDLMNLYGDDVLLITGPSLGPEGELLGQGRGAEVPLAVVPSLCRAIHPWRDWQSYRDIKRVLRKFRPDVVHTHSAKGGVLGRLAATSLGVPAVVHTVHGAPFHPYQGRGARALFRWCEWYAARKCHALVSVADAMTDLLVEARVAPREKFTTIYSGMEVEPFLAADEHRDAMRRELGFASEHVVIGKIARLFHLKGHEYVIDAAAHVVSRCPHVRFLLVGDGTLREKFERQIASAGLIKHFHFTGLVPPDRIPAFISAMDILVHASLREGLARALPQALIAGKPVVSFDIDGAREVVIPGETGCLIAPRQVAPLADALVELANDAALRRRLGQRGRELFTEQFRHETMTRQLRQLYQRLLGERQHSTRLIGERPA
jgi:glycosyltransferase involved in cell wall biosynthesis